MEKGKFYVARVHQWDGALDFNYSESFNTEEEAKLYVGKAYWPSDEVVVFECKAVKELK